MRLHQANRESVRATVDRGLVPGQSFARWVERLYREHVDTRGAAEIDLNAVRRSTLAHDRVSVQNKSNFGDSLAFDAGFESVATSEESVWGRHDLDQMLRHAETPVRFGQEVGSISRRFSSGCPVWWPGWHCEVPAGFEHPLAAGVLQSNVQVVVARSETSLHDEGDSISDHLTDWELESISKLVEFLVLAQNLALDLEDVTRQTLDFGGCGGLTIDQEKALDDGATLVASWVAQLQGDSSELVDLLYGVDLIRRKRRGQRQKVKQR